MKTTTMRHLIKYGGGLFIFAMWTGLFGMIFSSVWVGLICAGAITVMEHFIGKALSRIKIEEE